MKKIVIPFFAVIVAVFTIASFAAFEAHVINITAKIENALEVMPDEIKFGTVFPQEVLDEEIIIGLSDSFLEQDRVNWVHYDFKLKPKPKHEVIGEGLAFANHFEAHEWCLNNEPTEIGNPDDEYYINCYPVLCNNLRYTHKGGGGGSNGTILSPATNTEAIWDLSLKVPCFEGMCDQKYDESFYGEPLDPGLEHEIFGCDLWIEVTNIKNTEPIVENNCNFFEDFEDDDGFVIGGGSAQYWGTATLGGTATIPSNFTQGGSQSGRIFFGSFAKGAAEVPPPTMTLNLPDLSNCENIELAVSLAAPDGTMWESTHRDKLIIDSFESNIDTFLPALRGAPLTSQLYGTDLHPFFQDYSYNILDSDIGSIIFTFASTDYNEVIGIDSVRIIGEAKTPKPACDESKFDFCDNFETDSRNISKWSLIDNQSPENWIQNDGILGDLMYGQSIPTFEGFKYEVDFKITDHRAYALFRQQDVNNFYSIWFEVASSTSHGMIIPYGKHNGTWFHSPSIALTDRTRVDKDTWNKLTIVGVNYTFQFYINDRYAGEWTDPNNYFPSGHFGFQLQPTHEGVYYDNVRVIRLSIDDPVWLEREVLNTDAFVDNATYGTGTVKVWGFDKWGYSTTTDINADLDLALTGPDLYTGITCTKIDDKISGYEVEVEFIDNYAFNGLGSDIVIFERGTTEPFDISVYDPGIGDWTSYRRMIHPTYQSHVGGSVDVSDNASAFHLELAYWGIDSSTKIKKIRLSTLPWTGNSWVCADLSVVGALNSVTE